MCCKFNWIKVLVLSLFVIIYNVEIYGSNNDDIYTEFQIQGSLIVENPQSITVGSSSSVVYYLKAADGVSSFSWEVSSDNGLSWQEVGENSNVLIVENVSINQNNSLYRCTVTDGSITEVSESARLNVGECNFTCDAGPQVKSICGNGAQNYLTFSLSGTSNASHVLWEEHNGAGTINNPNTLNTEYKINQQDRGKVLVFTLKAWDTDNGIFFCDVFKLEIKENNDFFVELSEGQNNIPFDDDDYNGTVNLLNVDLIPVKYSSVDPEIQKKPFKESNTLLSSGGEDNIISELLIDLKLQDMPLNLSLSSAGLYLRTTFGGEEGLMDGDLLEVYPIDEKWDQNNVTWDTKPRILPTLIPVKSHSEYYTKLNGEEVFVKYFYFDIKSLVEKWYSGEKENFGLYVKIKDIGNINNEIKFTQTNNNLNRLSCYTYAWSGSLVYLCKNQELGVAVNSSVEGEYSWGGYGLTNNVGETQTIASHNSMTYPNNTRIYKVSGNFSGCRSDYYFWTAKTPIVTASGNVWQIDGSILDESPSNFMINGISARHKVKTINWTRNGDTQPFINGNKVSATYVTSKSDFGKYISLTINVESEKNCDTETLTKDLKVNYPLFPYAGNDIVICAGTDVTFTNATTTYNVDDIHIDEALGYVNRVEWSVDNGEGYFDDNTKLQATYIPSPNDREVVCTLKVYSIGDFNYKTNSVKISYVSDEGFSLGVYEGATIGELFTFNKIVYGNLVDAEISIEGHDPLLKDVHGYPTFTPTMDDLRRGYVTVKVWSPACSDINISSTLKVIPSIEGSTGGNVETCSGTAVQLLAYGGERYEWIPAEGLDNNLISNPMATLLESKEYTVRIYKNIDGEDFFIEKNVNVRINELPIVSINEFEPNVCPETVVTLNANYIQSNNYKWIASGEILKESNSFTFNVSEYPEVELQVTNKFGCSNTGYAQFNIQTSGDLVIGQSNCSSKEVLVSANNYDTYSWEPEGVFECASCASTKIVNPDNQTKYRFIGTAGGCTFEDEFKVVYQPAPIIEGKATYKVCPNEEVTFELNAIGENLIYEWTGSEGLSNSSILNPTFSSDHTVSFQLRVVDENGCETRKDFLVEVVELPALSLTNGISMCRGENYDLKLKNTADWIEWSPEDGISNPNRFYTSVSPAVSTNYQVTVGNGDCTRTENFSVEILSCSQGEFNYIFNEEDNSVTFVADGDADTFYWDFGDGTSSTNDTETKVYSEVGEYDVCLTVKGKKGTFKRCEHIKISPKDTNCQ